MAESSEANQSLGWQPPSLLTAPPFFLWSPKPFKVAKYIFRFPGYLWPWNAFYSAIAVVSWLTLTPELPEMRTLATGWIAKIFLVNFMLLTVITSVQHLWLYARRSQGTEYKYNARWPSTKTPAFLFGDQALDNAIWTLISAVPIWTAYEVLLLWAQANGIAPTVSWRVHPLYCTLILMAVPIIHEVHFYTIHRLIHSPALYRKVHSLHHKNINPGPWSGLAMHPVERLLYFSGVFLFFIFPATPLHVVYYVQRAALTPSKGHSGFGRIRIGGSKSFDNDHYMHYLHHKYFEVNFGGDGLVPIDKWLGTFHDGSEDALRTIRRRRKIRRNEG